MAVLENRKYECFCQEYLVDLNQTQAAIRAGYSPRSAGQTASALMKKPKVRARAWTSSWPSARAARASTRTASCGSWRASAL